MDDLSKILKAEVTMNNFIDFIKKKEQTTGIKIKEHDHILAMCITKFDWKCEKCNTNFDKKENKYYCSVCDYSVCEKCVDKNSNTLKKTLKNQQLSGCCDNFNDQFYETDLHEHRLVYCRSSRSSLAFNGWICNNCKKEFNNNDWSFYCTLCDYDLCDDCMESHQN